MKRAPLTLSVSLLCLGLCGCATSRTEEEATPSSDRLATVEAPLGSRIKRKSDIAPRIGANREDIEQTKVRQGAIQVGVANEGGP